MNHRTLFIRRPFGFSLIEMLVVMVIIGILASVTIVSMKGARRIQRDSTRLNDIRKIQSVLEMYFNDHEAYPTTLYFGSPLVSADGSKTYIERLPSNPTPRNDGQCPDEEYTYYGSNPSSYQLTFCISNLTADIDAGYGVAVSNGISDTGSYVPPPPPPAEPDCTPDCAGKECGDDGCGGVCGNCGANLICENGACNADCATNTDFAAVCPTAANLTLGCKCGGGTVVCRSSDSNCGVNLIVSPAHCTNTTTCDNVGNDITMSLVWDNDAISETASDSADGRLNFWDDADGDNNPPALNNDAKYASAKFCLNLNINGYSDWHLPAPYEACTLWRTSNRCSGVSIACANHAETAAGCLHGSSLTTGSPASSYWTSKQATAANAYRISYLGTLNSSVKTTNSLYTRCVRRF